MIQLNVANYMQKTIEFDELDAGDVLYHANYIKICDQARNHLFSTNGVTFFDLKAIDVALAVVEMNCRYSRPIRLQKITVATTLFEIRKKVMRLRHAFYPAEVALDDSTLAAPYFTQEVTLVGVNYSTGRACEIPELLTAKIAY